MKKILILIIFVLLTNNAISKENGIYHIHFPVDHSIECVLEMYEDGMYQMTLSDDKCIDVVYELKISFGNYEVINNNLYLYDNYNKYKMHYIIKKGRFYPQQTFKMLCNRTFSKYKPQSIHHRKFSKSHQTSSKLNDSFGGFASDIDLANYSEFVIPNVIPHDNSQKNSSKSHQALSEPDNSVYGYKNELNLDNKSKFVTPNVIPLDKSRTNFSKSHKALSKLYYGVYGDVNGLNLDIKSNGKYKMSYKKVVITEGNWERKENELICKDSFLNHNFYLSIDDDKVIVSRFLPSELQDCFLYLNE